MGLFSIFKRKDTQQEKELEDSTILWEDDFLMIEIIPKENWDFALGETQRIKDFGQEHFDGNGFTGITEIQKQPRPTSELGIKLEELTKTLEEAGMKRINNVLYDGRPIDSTKTVAYGENQNGLYIENKSGIVNNIWLAFYNRPLLLQGTITSGLLAIGERYKMMLIDWTTGKLADLRNREEIEEYLKS